MIFDIIKGSVHDGPGIRTTVFLKGCPLRCIWCHNPESQHFERELLWIPDNCILCGACIHTCPRACHTISDGHHQFRRDNCIRCGRCAEVCPEKALRISGRKMSIQEILDVVLEDRLFYEISGGGLTLSGGEPLAQVDFAEALLKAAHHQGIHTCIETCGYAEESVLERLAPLTDLWLFDFKADFASYPSLTGKPADIIFANLRKLAEKKSRIILRCPFVPGRNDMSVCRKELSDLVWELRESIQHVEVEPYNPLGEVKYAQLGRKCLMTAEKPSDAQTARWIALLREVLPCEVISG